MLSSREKHAICGENGGGGSRTRVAVPANGSPEQHLSLSEVRARLISRDGDACFYCGETFPAYHVDHVRAKANGGSDGLGNLVLACGPCNIEKRATPAWAFLFARALGCAPERLTRRPMSARYKPYGPLHLTTTEACLRFLRADGPRRWCP